jgi:hypothetical protein
MARGELVRKEITIVPPCRDVQRRQSGGWLRNEIVGRGMPVLVTPNSSGDNALIDGRINDRSTHF